MGNRETPAQEAAFRRSQLVWRSLEGDFLQVETQLNHLAEDYAVYLYSIGRDGRHSVVLVRKDARGAIAAQQHQALLIQPPRGLM